VYIHKVTKIWEALYVGFFDGLIKYKYNYKNKKRMSKWLEEYYWKAYNEGLKLSDKVFLEKDGYYVCRLCGEECKKLKHKILLIEKNGVLRRGKNSNRKLFITKDKAKLKAHLKKVHDKYVIFNMMPPDIRSEILEHFNNRIK